MGPLITLVFQTFKLHAQQFQLVGLQIVSTKMEDRERQMYIGSFTWTCVCVCTLKSILIKLLEFRDNYVLVEICSWQYLVVQSYTTSKCHVCRIRNYFILCILTWFFFFFDIVTYHCSKFLCPIGRDFYWISILQHDYVKNWCLNFTFDVWYLIYKMPLRENTFKTKMDVYPRNRRDTTRYSTSNVYCFWKSGWERKINWNFIDGI